MSHRPIYHVYNQGNDRRPIFVEEKNYGFFLNKVRQRFAHTADILAYCLMPNHFHFLLVPTLRGLSPSRSRAPVVNAPREEAFIQLTQLSVSVQGLLSGYAQSFNRHYGRSGSLFRQKTKMEATGQLRDDGVIIDPTRHTTNCFTYIHYNPVKANLCTHPSEWAYSSFLEYAGWLEEGEGLCNVELGRQLWSE